MNPLTGDTLQERQALPPACKGSYSKRKEFVPIGSILFPFRVDPFSEGALNAVNQNKMSQKLSPMYGIAEYLPRVFSPLNAI